MSFESERSIWCNVSLNWPKRLKTYLYVKMLIVILLVIRQKVKSQNGGYKKTKHIKFSKNTTFLAYQGLRNFSLSELAHLFSCNSRFEIRPFASLRTIYTLRVHCPSDSLFGNSSKRVRPGQMFCNTMKSVRA